MTAGQKATLFLISFSVYVGGTVALIACGFPVLGSILLIGPILVASWFLARATFEARW